MNLSYCRFQNTLASLRDCAENMDDEVDGIERFAKDELVKLCRDIADNEGA